MTDIESYTYCFTAENGDIVSDVYRTTITDDNQIRENVERFVNGRLISITITHFLNGHKHGFQIITKENGIGSQTFTNYFINGILQNNY
jgi:hypothetical protein